MADPAVTLAAVSAMPSHNCGVRRTLCRAAPGSAGSCCVGAPVCRYWSPATSRSVSAGKWLGGSQRSSIVGMACHSRPNWSQTRTEGCSRPRSPTCWRISCVGSVAPPRSARLVTEREQTTVTEGRLTRISTVEASVSSIKFEADCSRSSANFTRPGGHLPQRFYGH